MKAAMFPKINAPWKRDERGKFRQEWSTSELEFLSLNEWLWRAKIDGTNIRVIIERNEGGEVRVAEFRGRTDNAQTPKPLLERLGELFDSPLGCDLLEKQFGYLAPGEEVILYGEGYGAGIQKGADYGPVDFILFDVTVEGQWLKREAIEAIAANLNIRSVPIVGSGSIAEATFMIRRMALGDGGVFGDYNWTGFDWSQHSEWYPGKEPEGIVLVPAYGANLFDRKGHRIMTKLKLKDFR